MTDSRPAPPGTTWFLRDQADLDALVAALSRDRPPSRQVRLWSVGCSTGQEPYSLTMALLAAGLQPQVLATDVRKDFLAIASAARYPAQAVSVLPTAWRQQYTTRIAPDEVLIQPSVSARVSFRWHDVARSLEPPLGWNALDAVVCRNVLIYFERAEAVGIVRRLAGACRPGGYVLLSAAERPLAWMTAMLQEDDIYKNSVLLRRASSTVTRTSGSALVGPALAEQRPPVPPLQTATESLGTPEQAVAHATALFQRGEFARAIPILNQVLAHDPLQASAHLVRGLALKHLGQAKEAAAALRCARFLLSNEAWLAPYQLGILLEQLGHPTEAGEAYRHTLAVILAGGRSGLPLDGPSEDALLPTVTETCHARLRALAGQGHP